jgi:hypothetical protein
MRPLAQRVQWLMAQLDTDDADLAEAEIKRSDHSNATRMHDQFGVTWNDPVLFDMVLNTERLSVDTCVQLIKTLLQRDEFAQTDASLALLQGMALSAHVRSALRRQPHTHRADVTVRCIDGRVTLSGIVVDPDERAAVARVTAGVAGVREVDDQLRVMKASRHAGGADA